MLHILEVAKSKTVSRKPNIANPDKHKTTFSRTFHIGSIIIDVKNIKTYLDSQAKKWLKTEDYYSGYIYTDGILKFIIHKSNSHDVNKISKLSPVLMAPGNYYLHSDKNYFKFTHKIEKSGEVTIKQIIGVSGEHEQDDNTKGIINLDTYEMPECPKTLLMKWSLAKRQNHLTAIFAGLLIVMIAINLMFSQNLTQINQKGAIVANKIREMSQSDQSTQIKNITIPIEQLWKAIDSRGKISCIKGDQNSIAFAITFKNDNYARDFIKQNGGNYENGKVILNASFAGDSKPTGVK